MKKYNARSFYAFPGMTVAIILVPLSEELPRQDEEIRIDGGEYKFLGFNQASGMYNIDGTRNEVVHMIVHELVANIRDLRRVPEKEKPK